jgi:hypothetical protein
MKMYIHIALILIVSPMSLNVHAEGNEKNFNIGIGTYALIIAYDNSLAGNDDELGGFGLSALCAFYLAICDSQISADSSVNLFLHKKHKQTFNEVN